MNDPVLQERQECLLIAEETERFYREEAAMMTHVQAIEHCQGGSSAAWDIAFRIKARDPDSEEADILRRNPKRVVLDDSAINGYVNIRLTPREAKIVSMILKDTLTTEIADYFSITVERVEQIVTMARKKIDRARVKMATQATSEPCTVCSQEGEE